MVTSVPVLSLIQTSDEFEVLVEDDEKEKKILLLTRKPWVKL